MRLRGLTTTEVYNGGVRCPVTNSVEDLETCLSCARLAEVEGGAAGEAPQLVRCRLEGSWRDVPAAFMS